MKKVLVSLLMVLLVAPAFAQIDRDHDFKTAKNMDIFNSIYKNLDLMYVDTLDAQEVVGNGIKAMLGSLDPYTTYYPEEKVNELKNMLTGKYAGVGAVVRYNFQLQRVCISEPYENMPAAEVGLKKGDIILSIDDEDMTNKDVAYVSDHLRGDPGTSFIIKVKRPSTGKTLKMKITRRTIQMPFLPYYGMLEGGYGYINFNSFTDNCAKDVRRAFIDLKKQGAKGLVQTTMDLPYNGQMKLTTAKYYIPSGRCVQALNYKHAKGGYVEHVPDSLTKVFYTANGREVRDGGGVKPDVEVQPDSLPNIAFYLAGARDSNEVMLNYEVDYIAKHPTIAPAKDFALTDADYDEFKARVLKADFKYDRETEKYLKDLEKLAKFEGYYDDAKPEFEALKKKLSHNVAKDLDYNKEYIKQLLENEIVAAYYFQAGAIQNSLRYDKQIKEAVKLLNSPEEYKKILLPAKK